MPCRILPWQVFWHGLVVSEKRRDPKTRSIAWSAISINIKSIISLKNEMNAKSSCGYLTFRTAVMETPLLTNVSAIHPPIFAKTAMVNHGRTHKSPDSVRLNFRTWDNHALSCWFNGLNGNCDVPCTKSYKFFAKIHPTIESHVKKCIKRSVQVYYKNFF